MKRTLTFALATSLALATFSARATPPVRVAQASNHAADEQTFKEFEQIVADFSTPEKIQAWEAFLQKYPSSSYVPKVHEIIAELKGEKKPIAAAPAATPAPTPYTRDPDLDFLNDPSSKPTPPPRPVATPAPVVFATPRPTPRPQPTSSFLDSPSNDHGGASTRSDRFSWNDAGSSSGSSAPAERPVAREDSFAGGRRLEPPRTPPRRPWERGIERKYHLEISPFVGISPDETYVRNLLFGVSVAEHFGRTWSLSLEGAGSQDSETPLLRSLRNLDAEPEVISKYNFVAGATLEANLLSAMDPVTNAIEGRNDLYLHGGAGDVNTNLEICKQTGGVKCASPLFINGVNFTYVTAGVGHRFYFTRALLFRTEIRGRLVFELIDGKTNPRANVQIDLGPSFLF